MEQNSQQFDQESDLPIKTKVAAYWIRVIGILAFILSIILFFTPPMGYAVTGLYFAKGFNLILGFISIITGILFLKSSNLLFKKRGSGWWLGIITILTLGNFVLWSSMDFDFIDLIFDSLEDLLGFSLFFIIPFVITFVPTILLLLDRKNFFKIAK